MSWALEPSPGPDVLDLGAGTGKLTSALLGRTGLRVTAVDPDPGMLRELRLRIPGADAREGSAEAVPLPDGSVDAVVVGQAWHWFDPERALPEVARVLRPGGVLAALWNGDDVSVEWVAGLHDVTPDPSMPPGRCPTPDGHGLSFPAHADFAPSAHTRFPHRVRTTVDGLIATLRTHSWALVSEPAEREAAVERLRAYLRSRPETSAGEFVLPMRTDVLRAVRR